MSHSPGYCLGCLHPVNWNRDLCERCEAQVERGPIDYPTEAQIERIKKLWAEDEAYDEASDREWDAEHALGLPFDTSDHSGLT